MAILFRFETPTIAHHKKYCNWAKCPWTCAKFKRGICHCLKRLYSNFSCILVRNHYLPLVAITSYNQPSKAINVCFDSPIDCFSSVDGIEIPLEIKGQWGALSKMEEQRGWDFDLVISVLSSQWLEIICIRCLFGNLFFMHPLNCKYFLLHVWVSMCIVLFELCWKNWKIC